MHHTLVKSEKYPGKAKAKFKQRRVEKVKQQKIRPRVKCLPYKPPQIIPTMIILRKPLNPALLINIIFISNISQFLHHPLEGPVNSGTKGIHG